MDVKTIVLTCMEQVLGLEEEELLEESGESLDLIESGALDSFSIVTLLTEISSRIGVKLDIVKMKPEDFSGIEQLVAAVQSQLDQ